VSFQRIFIMMACQGKLEDHPLFIRQRRRTLGCGEEQRPKLEDSDDDTEASESPFAGVPSNLHGLLRCTGTSQAQGDARFVQAVLSILKLTGTDKWGDASKEAFVALRHSSHHVSVETLAMQAMHARSVFAFLLNTYAAKGIYRSLVAETLQELTRSRQWRWVAQHPSIQEHASQLARQLSVSGPDTLGQLHCLGKEKVAQFFNIFDLQLESFTQDSHVKQEPVLQDMIGPATVVPVCLRVRLLLACSTTAICLVFALLVHFLQPAISQSMCSSMECPPFHRPKANSSKVTCTGIACNTRIDLEVCCDRQALCSSMQCPLHHIRKPSAKDVPCEGSTCTLETDTSRCCDPVALCSSIKCPLQHVRIADAAHVPCLSAGCSLQEDVHRCCKRSQSGLSDFLACPRCQVANGLVGMSDFFNDKLTVAVQ
jgi:hypothetical protein